MDDQHNHLHSAPAAEYPHRVSAPFRFALDAVFPPQCLKCGAIVGADGALCERCWPLFEFISNPHCAACGVPFDYDLGPAALCGACTRHSPDYDRARSVLVYADNSRDLILSFKHADQTNMAPTFGQWMVRAGTELLKDADLLVPVPLHWTRLFHRRFNQAAVIAREIAKETAIPVAARALIRRRRTPSQGHLNRRQRHLNVRSAFAVKSAAGTLTGKNLILIDDVLTTGATVSACARALRRAGAARIDVLTLARVVGPQDHQRIT